MPVKVKPVSPDFFNFDEGTIHRISQEFGLPGLDEFYPILLDGDTCSLLEVRSETSRKMIVGSGSSTQKYFLKQVPWYCDSDALVTFSHSVQSALFKHGSPVAKIYPAKSGKTWLDINDVKFVLFEHKNGRRYNGDREQICSAAFALAELHSCPFVPKQHVPEDYFTLARNHILLLADTDKIDHQYKDEIIILGRELDIAEKYCKMHGWDGMKPSIIHGDYNPWNILFQPDGGVSAILDFDNCDYGPRIHDIAEAIVTFAYMNYKSDSTNFVNRDKVQCDEEVVSQIIQSYSSHSSISMDERMCLPGAVKATMIELYCLGLVRRDFDKSSFVAFREALENVPSQIQQLTEKKEINYGRKIFSWGFNPT